MTENITPIVIGLAFVFISLKTLVKQNRLKKIGIKAEGIVFDLAKDSDASFSFTYPIIRFTTISQEWITEITNTSIFPGLFKKGQKVIVVYNQDSPKEFILVSKISTFILYAFLIVGILLILLGAYLIIRVKL